jgi:hypothetical protein|eukprot:SAG25_NODE_8871_length_399_cov_1.006667_1_plen_81_part_00
MAWCWSAFAGDFFGRALPVAVGAKDRAKAAELVPADDELLHVGALVGLLAAATVPAHVRRPPRDALSKAFPSSIFRQEQM